MIRIMMSWVVVDEDDPLSPAIHGSPWHILLDDNVEYEFVFNAKCKSR